MRGNQYCLRSCLSNAPQLPLQSQQKYAARQHRKDLLLTVGVGGDGPELTYKSSNTMLI